MAEPDTGELRLEAQRLLRSIRTASLATLDGSGTPFASLTAIATMPDGRPILLLSRLAAHTQHLESDPRCSLLLAQTGKGDPLAHPRLTLVGEARRLAEPGAARARFLARNPKAELYADFPDFSFWAVTLGRASLNGGFGRAAQFKTEDLLTETSGCEGLIEGEVGAVEHMNADHRDAIVAYATGLLGQTAGDWRLTGLDPAGADLAAGDRTARLVFPEPIRTPGDLRRVLVALAAEARQRSSQST